MFNNDLNHPTLDSPEVHVDWLLDLCSKMLSTYSSVGVFASQNNLDDLDCFWFFKGTPVREAAFKSICKALGYDHIQVQNPKE